MKTKKIAILATNDSLASTIYGILDAFATANYCARELGWKTTPFKVCIISPDGKRVKSYNGYSIEPDGDLELAKDADVIILAPVMPAATEPENIDKYIQPLRPVANWVKERSAKGVCIASSCTGSFFLAETGLLDGKVATTHWRASQAFKDRYPRVILQSQELVTSNGNILCGGGAVSYIDLSIHLIEKFTKPLLAIKCAQMLVIDSGRDRQSPYNSFAIGHNHNDKDILTSQEWLEMNYTRQVNIDDLASNLGMSTRSFNRRFKAACGETPLEYLQKIRISSACDRLITGNLPIQQIVWNIGYEDVSSFCRLFKRRVGTTMEMYRKKFQNKDWNSRR